MSSSSVAAIALIATITLGAIVATQPPINAELARRTSALAAAAISAGITFTLLATLFMIIGDWSSLSGLRQVPVLYLTGGLAGAAFVIVSLLTIKELGAGVFVAAIVTAQLIVAAILDQLGILGLTQAPISPLRAIGFAALITGTVLVTAF